MSKDKINIDKFFKNALEGAEGRADDASFLAIQSKLAQQNAAAGAFKMYRLLYLLIIPCAALLIYYLCPTGNNPANPVASHTPSVSTEQEKAGASTLSDQTIHTGTPAQAPVTTPATATTPHTGTVKSAKTETRDALYYGKETDHESAPDPVAGKTDITQETEGKTENTTPVQKDVTEGAGVAVQDAKEIVKKDPEQVLAPGSAEKADQKKAANATHLRQHKTNNLLEIYGAAAISDRMIDADAMHAKYLSARNQADKQSVRYNAGINFTRNMGRMAASSGLGVRQFGQSGSYSITRNISDSVPVYDSLNHLKGYLYFNQRDTNYFSPYNNIFTNVEIPFHIDYTLLKNDRWDYRIGLGATINYMVAAKGALPNLDASGVVPVSAGMPDLHRFGSSVSITNRIGYNIGKQWQVSTEVYYKHQITSLYKKSSGIKEMPFDLGWRFGFGYKF